MERFSRGIYRAVSRRISQERRRRPERSIDPFRALGETLERGGVIATQTSGY